MGSYTSPKTIIPDYNAFERSFDKKSKEYYLRGEREEEKALRREELDARTGNTARKEADALRKSENKALKAAEELYGENEGGYKKLLVDPDSLVKPGKKAMYDNETGREAGTIDAGTYTRVKANVINSAKELKATQAFLAQNNEVFSEAADLGTISKDPDTLENTAFTNGVDKGRGKYVTKEDGTVSLRVETQDGTIIERPIKDLINEPEKYMVGTKVKLDKMSGLIAAPANDVFENNYEIRDANGNMVAVNDDEASKNKILGNEEFQAYTSDKRVIGSIIYDHMDETERNALGLQDGLSKIGGIKEKQIEGVKNWYADKIVADHKPTPKITQRARRGDNDPDSPDKVTDLTKIRGYETVRDLLPTSGIVNINKAFKEKLEAQGATVNDATGSGGSYAIRFALPNGDKGYLTNDMSNRAIVNKLGEVFISSSYGAEMNKDLYDKWKESIKSEKDVMQAALDQAKQITPTQEDFNPFPTK